MLRPGSFDYPFVFNLIGGYRLSPEWELSARAVVSVGPARSRRTTRRCRRRSGAASTTSTRVNAERAPDYGRVDVRVDRTFTVGGQPLNVFFGVQNVTNRRNFAGYIWNRRTNARAVRRAAGPLPDPRVRLAVLEGRRALRASVEA